MEPLTGTNAEPSERYARQLRLEGFTAEHQCALRDARIAVIGAGGLGSPVLTYLAAAGVGNLRVIDPDTVDVTNLHRQVLHSQEMIGEAKAVSAAQALSRLNPEVTVEPVTEALTTSNALELLAGSDLVIDGADNFPTRYLSSDACEILDLPLVWGSILAWNGQLSLFHAQGGRGVTYRDLHPVPPRPGEVPSCAEAGVLGMLCGVIGSAMAMEAIKHLTGLGTTLDGRLALYDALRMRWQEIPIARDPARAPVTALEDLQLTCGLPGPTGPALQEVSAQDLPALYARGVRLVDIREVPELQVEGTLEGAEHLPMSRILTDQTVSDGIEGAVLFCAAGTRSAAVQRTLAARGVQVLSLRGGIAAARDAGAVIRPYLSR